MALELPFSATFFDVHIETQRKTFCALLLSNIVRTEKTK